MDRIALGVFLISAAVCATWSFPTSPVVELADGKLVGDVREDRNGGKYFAFQSVPYAKPPIGDLRFRAPEATGPWTGTLNATKPIPVCLQASIRLGEIIGQDDCLYLNIYTPHLPIKDEALLPVMVFFHGGGFYIGSSVESGPEHLLPEGVVLITVHYRLGVLGFLNYDDESAGISANNGLKDQNFALKWIRQNVQNFGGNPNLVTIFGQSAGGASVHFHMLSPKSQGLFHRVIAQSGCALNNWAKGSRNNALLLGKQVGLDGITGAELGKKLRQLPVEEIIQGQTKIKEWNLRNNGLWPGAPIIEPRGPNAFLTAEPETAITSGNFTKVPLMLGFTNKEAYVFQALGDIDNKYLNFSKQFPYDLVKDNPEKIPEVLGKLKEHYLGGVVPEGYTDGYIDLLSDVWFTERIVETARKHYKFGQVFLYEFSADTKLNFFKLSSNLTANRKGASHIDELGYVFKSSPSLVVDKGSIEDVSISRVVKLWTNFAKFGNPTPEKLAILDNLVWSPVEEGKLNFMDIGNSLKVGEMRDETLEFWKKLYKEI